MTKEIVIKKEVSPVLKKAQGIEIKNGDDMKVAVELLSNLNKHLDSVTEEKEKVTKPLNEALKAERGRWKPIETELEEAINSVRSKMISYQTEETRRQKQEEAKIEARVGEGKGKLKFETAIKKIDEIEKAEATVSTDSGVVKFKTVKKFEVMDITMVPKEFLLADEVAIRKEMVSGREVKGVRYYEEQVPLNFR